MGYRTPPYTRIGDASFDSNEDMSAANLWALPLLTSPKRELAEGLLVVPIGESSGCGMRYRRVGRWSVPQNFPREPKREYAYPSFIHDISFVEVVVI
jgi:hypothetical protein